VPIQPDYPLLVIDAGNTAVKFAVVTRKSSGPKLLRVISTEKLTEGTARKIGAKSRGVVVASVVPSASRVLKRAFPAAHFVGPGTPLDFKTLVNRQTIGSDRLANVAAAQARFGGNVLVASFGTAATFDILDKRGVHLGGVIAPGWSSFAALTSANAAQLPRIDQGKPTNAIGRNTREALRAGVNGGYAALVSQLIARIKKEAKASNARVVFTGGDAPTVAKLTGLKVITDPLLTIKGIAILARPNVRKGRK
jgi:type III pantothenate kinase